MQRLEPGWMPAPHIDLIEDIILSAIFDPDACRRICIEIPPRHGKSTYVSKYLPARFLDWFPSRWVILSSYEAKQARKWGRRVRNLILTNPQEFRIRLKGDLKASDFWEVAIDPCWLQAHPESKEVGGGGMVTAGAGGAITGHGGDLFIIDDPIKSFEEAESALKREKTWDWLTGTARDRLEPKALMVMILQRWHEDDVAGRIVEAATKNGGEPWRIVRLPAEAQKNDPLGRAIDEPLWPGRYPMSELRAIRQALGSYKYSAKFQQQPLPAKGSLFKRSNFLYFREVDGYFELTHRDGTVKRVLKSSCVCFQTCDPSGTENDDSHYFALGTWYLTPDSDLLLYDVFREKALTTKHMHVMVTHYQRYKPKVQLVEDKSFGLNIYQSGIKTYRLPMKQAHADTSKIARALNMQPLYEAGRVFHRGEAPWLTCFEDEILRFPKGKNDDQVDMAAYAAIYAQNMVAVDLSKSMGTTGKKRVSSEVGY